MLHCNAGFRERHSDCRVLIHKSEREALADDDEFYSNDLVGLLVALDGGHPAVSATTAVPPRSTDAAAGDHTAAAAGTAAADMEAGSGGGPPAADGGAAAGENSTSSMSSGSDSEERQDQEWDGEDRDEEVVVALGEVVDVYDGTGTHGVLRIEFREGLQMMPDGQLEELSAEERSAAEVRATSCAALAVCGTCCTASRAVCLEVLCRD